MLAVNNTTGNHHDGPEFINAELVAAKDLQAAQSSPRSRWPDHPASNREFS